MIIFLNNKANLKIDEFKSYKESLENIKTDHRLVLMPTSIYLSIAESDKYILGSQEVSRFLDGNHTGRISVDQLKALDIKYTLIGHSEMRWELGETNEEINDKIKILLKNNITPILCVGELTGEKEIKDLVILRQLKLALLNLKKEEKEKVIIAYEPRWAIGSGLMPTKEKIMEVVNLIKKELPNNKIIYGGSININTIDEVKDLKLDGLLIGNASYHMEELGLILDKIKS